MERDLEKMVTVGVSGHRDLVNLAAISAAVDNIFQKIHDTYGEKIGRVISPLAEGTDRLVAKRAIEKYSAQLVVPLPFEISRYMLDFKSSASKTEFADLIKLAYKVIQLPDKDTRGASFLAAGLYTLNHSDVLIAIWDGKPARGIGGTAQIVSEARKQGKPVAWVQVEDQEEDTANVLDTEESSISVHYERFPV